MTQLIIAFSGLVLLAGLVILVNPGLVFAYLQKNADKPVLHILAVVVRLVLGFLLISQAGYSRFPTVIEVLGWLSVIAAVSLALMGRKNFKRLMAWAFTLIQPWGRPGGLLAMAFGAFLIYAFIP
jgi:NAD/NADP transhydrogenase beta subunit